jgi:WD40 repeat protein
MSTETKILFSGRTGMKIWNANSFKKMTHIKNDECCISVSKDKTKIVSNNYYKGVKLWNVSTKKCISSNKTTNITCSTFSPDNGEIITGGKNHFGIWDNNLRPIKCLDLNTHDIMDITYSSDNSHIISGTYQGNIIISDTNTRIFQIIHTKSNIWTISCSDNDSLVACAGPDTNIYIYDITGNIMNTLKGHSGVINRITYNSNYQIIGSASYDKTIKIWDTRTNTSQKTLYEDSFVNSVAFSSDNSSIVSGCYNGMANIWDIRTGTIKNNIQSDLGEIHDVSFL